MSWLSFQIQGFIGQAGLQFIDTSLGKEQPLPGYDLDVPVHSDRLLNLAEMERNAQLKQLREKAVSSWYSHHVARKEQLQVFAPELNAGTYVFEYTARALTAGTFLAPAPHVEELHVPETFGRGNGATIVVQ